MYEHQTTKRRIIKAATFNPRVFRVNVNAVISWIITQKDGGHVLLPGMLKELPTQLLVLVDMKRGPLYCYEKDKSV